MTHNTDNNNYDNENENNNEKVSDGDLDNNKIVINLWNKFK